MTADSRTGWRGLTSLAITAALFLTLAAPADAFQWLVGKSRGQTIVDRLERSGRFEVLLAALDATGLDEVLDGDGRFTLFAPTDEAFAPLVEDGTVDALLAEEDLETLTRILLYHVVDGKRRIGRLLVRRNVETLEGSNVEVEARRRGIHVNDTRIVDANNRASNGVIHAIDGVLLPPEPPGDLVKVLEDDGRFTILLAALKATGLDEALGGDGPFTVFAPTDEAFAPLVEDGTVDALLAEEGLGTLTQILLYHVVGDELSRFELVRKRRVETLQGASVKVTGFFFWTFVNRERVIQSDVEAGNGVAHVIDGVLIPPQHD
jgi:uncharacterized surface protein with fasciclin (FAS1) repeats